MGVVKLGASFLDGSSAMLVESIHSAIDTLNQGLLLFGLRRARRPADDRHPFGYGLETYFWTFVVALLILSFGGLASIWTGIERLRHPAPVEHVGLSLGVIALCLLFDIAAFVVALREAERGRPALSRKRMPKSRCASPFTSVPIPPSSRCWPRTRPRFWDSSSRLAFGVMGSAWLGIAEADGIAAIAIGVLLILLAGVVIFETQSLLTAEAALPSIVDAARAILADDGRVDSVCELLSMHLGPQEILMAATVDFCDDLTGPQLEEAVDELTERLKKADPRITRLFIRPGRAA